MQCHVREMTSLPYHYEVADNHFGQEELGKNTRVLNQYTRFKPGFHITPTNHRLIVGNH